MAKIYSQRDMREFLNGLLDWEAGPLLDCTTDSPQALDRFPTADTVFVYACNSDEFGAPFVEAIIQRSGLFIPAFESTPSLYVHNNESARIRIRK